MNTLRLFINEELNDAISWIILEDDVVTNKGNSSFEEIYSFEIATIEVYLAASLCGIFKLNVTNISDRKLYDGVILSKLEDQLVDEIEDLKPLLLRIDENIAYIAVFNLDFYDNLMEKLGHLNKNVKFIQSIAFSVVDNPDGWVLYFSEEESFVRISTYEYSILDDNEPIPLVLDKMLQQNPPKSIIVYGAQQRPSLITELENKNPALQVKLADKDLVYGVTVWNFYNQKNSKFKLKLNTSSKGAIALFLRVFKYLAILLFTLWLIEMLVLYTKQAITKSAIRSDLQSLSSVKEVTPAVIQNLNDKVLALQHSRGQYGQNDMLPLFSAFLEVVSVINTDDITRITYKSGTLNVFLRAKFKTNDFANYKNIFATQQIMAMLTDYPTYKANNTITTNDSNADINLQPDISKSTAWVVSLTHSTNMFNTTGY